MLNRTFYKLTLLVIAGVCTACGSAGSKLSSKSSNQISFSGVQTTDSGTTTTSTTNTTPTSTTSTTSTSTNTSGYAPIIYRVGASGYTSTSVSVYAQHVLKVQFTPGIQDQNVAGSGASIQYGALGLYIEVGSSSRPTPFLSNGAFGGIAEKSAIMDYSGSIGSTCSGSDSSCRSTVTITITKPNYDYWCRQFGMGCPWVHVSDNHPWHGTLEIQTDDTMELTGG